MPHRAVLTDRQRSALFDLPTDEPSLRRHYTLADDDLEYIYRRRRDENRLGFALQLCALRYPGRVLQPGELIPSAVVAFIGAQLGHRRGVPAALCSTPADAPGTHDGAALDLWIPPVHRPFGQGPEDLAGRAGRGGALQRRTGQTLRRGMPKEAGHPACGLDARTPVRRRCRCGRPANRGENRRPSRHRHTNGSRQPAYGNAGKPHDALRLAAEVRTGQQCRHRRAPAGAPGVPAGPWSLRTDPSRTFPPTALPA